jgi:hypothetical protein
MKDTVNIYSKLDLSLTSASTASPSGLCLTQNPFLPALHKHG